MNDDNKEFAYLLAVEEIAKTRRDAERVIVRVGLVALALWLPSGIDDPAMNLGVIGLVLGVGFLARQVLLNRVVLLQAELRELQRFGPVVPDHELSAAIKEVEDAKTWWTNWGL